MPENQIILPVLILIPFIGAVLVILFPIKDIRRTAGLALFFSAGSLVLTLLLFGVFVQDGIDEAFKFEFQCGFFPQLGSSIHFGLDGISLWLILLANVLFPLSIWSSFTSIKQSPHTYYSLILLLQAAMTAVFLSMDLLMFYIFFEFTLLPLFLIVGIWGGARRRPAAYKLFIYTLTGGGLQLAAILWLGWLHYSQTDILTFEIQQLYQTHVPVQTQGWLFLAFFLGFAIKAPLFPFHTWLPLAYTEAPTAGSVLLAGVISKLGTYGFLRILIPVLPLVAFKYAPFIAILALVGIIYGSLCAWVQPDMKKLIAYASFAHIGFCTLGMFAFNHTGLSGSLLYMFNHGISIGGLFLVVGMIYERYHTREIVRLGGLARNMPIMAFFLVLFSLSSIGLPGLNGFISEFTILYAVFTSKSQLYQLAPLGPVYAIIAATGVVLSAVYMLWLCQRILFGPLKEPQVVHEPSLEKLPVDLSRREWLILTPLALLVVLLGVYPNIFFITTKPALKNLDQQICTTILQENKYTNEHPTFYEKQLVLSKK